MPLCQIPLRCKGNSSPFNGCFRHPELLCLPIKNYEYKLLNAWFVFLFSTAKIAKLSHIPQKNTQRYLIKKSPQGIQNTGRGCKPLLGKNPEQATPQGLKKVIV